MKNALIQTGKVAFYILLLGSALIGLGTFFEAVDEADCIRKGEALHAEVKFYQGHCYVKGYSDGR
ncbi:MAG: hypothetical protein ABF628_04345 [Acetobacter orientalis]|uniref:hypothetical protein n=1 Tax=Acetobacter orientalis TaxID=146474 RepID=UPI0039ECA4BF